MEAQTLNCPMCGAAAATDATQCQHCGARLATVSCPSCFGMMFLGAKFCSHCGAKADRKEFSPETIRRCPRCRVNTKPIVVGQANLRECPRCEGIWADADALQRICEDREQQAAVLGIAMTLAAPGSVQIETVRYVPCPVCQKLMNRVNFARCSKVVVDVCKPHGTWFDKDELRRIVEFIRTGGIEKARLDEIEELGRQRRELEASRIATGGEMGSAYRSSDYGLQENALSFAAAAVISALFD